MNAEITQHLISIYREECLRNILHETMKIMKELPLNHCLKKVIINQETYKAIKKEHLSRIRFDTIDNTTITTLYGIPVDVDDSIAPGDIVYVIVAKKR